MTTTTPETEPLEGVTLPEWATRFGARPMTLGTAADNRNYQLALVPAFELAGWRVEWLHGQFGGESYCKVYPPGWTDADQADLEHRQHAAVRTSRFD